MMLRSRRGCREFESLSTHHYIEIYNKSLKEKEMDEEIIESDQDENSFVDELFAFCNIFKIISDVEKFLIWLGDKNQLDFFLGYQFFLKAVYRAILKNLAQNDYEFFSLKSCFFHKPADITYTDFKFFIKTYFLFPFAVFFFMYNIKNLNFFFFVFEEAGKNFIFTASNGNKSFIIFKFISKISKG